MSTNYHTDVAASGNPIQASDVTAPDGQLDAALTTINAAGWVTTTRLADGSVTLAKMAADSVGATQLVDGSVSAATLDPATIATPQNIVWDVYNRRIAVGTDFGGKSRWYLPAALSLLTPDGSNPYGAPTLQLLGSGGGVGGIKIDVGEAGIAPPNDVIFRCRVKAASGSYSFNARCFNASDATVGGLVGTGNVTITTETYLTTPPLTVQAGTAYIVVWWTRASGTADLSIYARWGARGQFIGDDPPPDTERFAPDLPISNNIVWDTFNHEFAPGQDFGGRSRWHRAVPGYRAVYPDSTNPYGGVTLVMDDMGSYNQAGKKIYLRDVGLTPGTTKVAFSARMASALGTTGTLRCGFWSQSAGLISSVFTSASLTATPTTVSTTLTAIPATTDYILLTTERLVASNPLSVYAIWGGVGGPTPEPGPSPLTGQLIAGEAALNLHEVGRARLPQWRTKAAGLLRADAGTKAVVNLFGDSWFQRDIIRNPLTDYMVSLYGDAGSGYIGIVFGSSFPYNWTWSRTGTWTEVDIDDVGTGNTAKGPDGTHATTTDTSATWVVTATVTDYVLHYRTQSGGGSFAWKIDAGSPNTVPTSAAADYHTLAIPAGSLGSHTLTITIPTAGTGVTICGVEARKDQNGVRINKLGNGSSTATTWAAMNATDWEAGVTALGGDLNFLLLGTNDRAHNIPPSVYAGNLVTLIDRLQAALPLADTVLVMPGDVDSATTFFSSAYQAAMRHVATLRPHVAFVSLYETLSPYTDSNTRGLMADGLHPNSLGGSVIANVLADFLRVR